VIVNEKSRWLEKCQESRLKGLSAKAKMQGA
jgi:hypothetical protein